MIIVPNKFKSNGKIKVGLDLDGTITDFPDFFAALSQNPQFEVHVITGRGEEHKNVTIAELQKYGIRYDALHLVDAIWHKKGEICKELGIQIMFDDMDEFINHIDDSTMVFKVRNGGNWDSENKNWMY